jgi:hypothetical protein
MSFFIFFIFSKSGLINDKVMLEKAFLWHRLSIEKLKMSLFTKRERQKNKQANDMSEFKKWFYVLSHINRLLNGEIML